MSESQIQKLAGAVRDLAEPAGSMRQEMNAVVTLSDRCAQQASSAGPHGTHTALNFEEAGRQVDRALALVSQFGGEATAFADRLAGGSSGGENGAAKRTAHGGTGSMSGADQKQARHGAHVAVANAVLSADFAKTIVANALDHVLKADGSGVGDKLVEFAGSLSDLAHNDGLGVAGAYLRDDVQRLLPFGKRHL